MVHGFSSSFSVGENTTMQCILMTISYYSGVWIDSNHEVMYALASKITFICQMDFNAFPVDIQVRTDILNKDLDFIHVSDIHTYEYIIFMIMSNIKVQHIKCFINKKWCKSGISFVI